MNWILVTVITVAVVSAVVGITIWSEARALGSR